MVITKLTLDDFHDLMLRLGGFCFISSPYTRFEQGTDKATADVCKITGRLQQAGICAFSPIAHSDTVAYHARIDKYDAKFWMRAHAPMLERAEVLVVVLMPGWADSLGVRAEMEYFRENEWPVYYLNITSFEFTRAVWSR